MDDYTKTLLTTLGEAGGISGMVGMILYVLIKTIKQKGCTFKCHNCSGQPIVEVDCEEGAPSARYFPRPWRRSTAQQAETSKTDEV